MAGMLIMVCVVVFVILMYFCLRTYTRFDREILDISRKRDNGKVEKRSDGLYMYYNGEWHCIDKNYDAEVTYVSPLDADKIISDFNRGIKHASYRNKMF